MNVDMLFNESMSLAMPERVSLVQRLLLSLDELSQAETESLWLDEAEDRLAAFDSGSLLSSSMASVFDRARAALA